jgi:hypothetical protein
MSLCKGCLAKRLPQGPNSGNVRGFRVLVLTAAVAGNLDKPFVSIPINGCLNIGFGRRLQCCLYSTQYVFNQRGMAMTLRTLGFF